MNCFIDAITPQSFDELACGCVCTRVKFPNVNTIEDLINALMTCNDDFIIMDTKSFIYLDEEEVRCHGHQFMQITIIASLINRKMKLRENDRFFFLSNSKFNIEGLYIACQHRDNLKIAEIVSIKRAKVKMHGTIQIDRPEQSKKAKIRLFHHTKKNNEKIYEKLE